MDRGAFFEPLSSGKARCLLCAHECVIAEGRRGKCQVRENRGGEVVSLVYGKACSLNADPIEKKPFFHLLPGTLSMSVATVGCNLTCRHCQNFSISQWPREHGGEIFGEDLPPERVVEAAMSAGASTMACTYTEPTVFLEYALDIAEAASAKGIRTVFVSNGFMSEKSAAAAAGHIVGNNIDLKGDDRFYREICGARLGPVQDTIRAMHAAGVWVEVTTLVIPGLNDSEQVLTGIAEFVASVSASMPWHVTRFSPTYKLTDRGPTPVNTLRRAREIGKTAGLKYVYEGNVPGEGGENTYCYSCGELLIKRYGFTIAENRMGKGVCQSCNTTQDGIWS